MGTARIVQAPSQGIGGDEGASRRRTASSIVGDAVNVPSGVEKPSIRVWQASSTHCSRRIDRLGSHDSTVIAVGVPGVSASPFATVTVGVGNGGAPAKLTKVLPDRS